MLHNISLTIGEHLLCGSVLACHRPAGLGEHVLACCLDMEIEDDAVEGLDTAIVGESCIRRRERTCDFRSFTTAYSDRTIM